MERIGVLSVINDQSVITKPLSTKEIAVFATNLNIGETPCLIAYTSTTKGILLACSDCSQCE